MAVQKHDATMVPAGQPPLPLHDRVMSWIWTTVEREGGNLHMGFELATILEDVGLEVVHAGAEAVVRTPRDADALAPIVSAMLPRILAHRVASAADIEIDTLGQRPNASSFYRYLAKAARARVSSARIDQAVYTPRANSGDEVIHQRRNISEQLVARPRGLPR